MLAWVDISAFAVHVHCGDAKEAASGRWQGDLAAVVFRAVEVGDSDPALVEAALDVGAEVGIVLRARVVGGV